MGLPHSGPLLMALIVCLSVVLPTVRSYGNYDRKTARDSTGVRPSDCPEEDFHERLEKYRSYFVLGDPV